MKDDVKGYRPKPGTGSSQGDRLELDVSVADPWYRLDDPAYGENDFRFSVGYGPNPVIWDLGRGTVLAGCPGKAGG